MRCSYFVSIFYSFIFPLIFLRNRTSAFWLRIKDKRTTPRNLHLGIAIVWQYYERYIHTQFQKKTSTKYQELSKIMILSFNQDIAVQNISNKISWHRHTDHDELNSRESSSGDSGKFSSSVCITIEMQRRERILAVVILVFAQTFSYLFAKPLATLQTDAIRHPVRPRESPLLPLQRDISINVVIWYDSYEGDSIIRTMLKFV